MALQISIKKSCLFPEMIILLLIEPLIKKSRKMLPAVNANKPPSGGGGKCQEFNFLFFFFCHCCQICRGGPKIKLPHGNWIDRWQRFVNYYAQRESGDKRPPCSFHSTRVPLDGVCLALPIRFKSIEFNSFS